MADTPELEQEVDLNQPLETDIEVEGEAAANEPQPGANNGTEGDPNEGEPEEDGLHIQFGDEEPPSSGEHEKSAPQWVKDLRKEHQELKRKLREAEAKSSTQQTTPQAPVIGPKPKLDDFDYDEGKFAEALGNWYAEKAKADNFEADQRRAVEAQQEAHNKRLASYQAEAVELRAKDFKDAEAEVVAVLSPALQGILLAGAEKPALLIYALGRNPLKLKQLAAETDPVRFAFAAAKLEKELKVTPRNASKPAPEGRVSSASGGAAVGNASEKKLEQLRAEAEKTGDLSKVLAYKAQLKKQQQR